eukprot:m.9523 g.9523  ORF g.9523 m.9523 type:complete len:64 (+) comp7210_c0_seq1:318-509(+)
MLRLSAGLIFLLREVFFTVAFLCLSIKKVLKTDTIPPFFQQFFLTFTNPVEELAVYFDAFVML